MWRLGVEREWWCFVVICYCWFCILLDVVYDEEKNLTLRRSGVWFVTKKSNLATKRRMVRYKKI
jgi:hypothetical protein